MYNNIKETLMKSIKTIIFVIISAMSSLSVLTIIVPMIDHNCWIEWDLETITVWYLYWIVTIGVYELLKRIVKKLRAKG